LQHIKYKEIKDEKERRQEEKGKGEKQGSACISLQVSTASYSVTETGLHFFFQ